MLPTKIVRIVLILALVGFLRPLTSAMEEGAAPLEATETESTEVPVTEAPPLESALEPGESDPEKVEPIPAAPEPMKAKGKGADILLLWEMGDKSEAFRLVKQWMDQEKKQAEPWIVAAELYFREGQYKKCLKRAKKALKKMPQASRAYYWRGRAFEELKKPLEAANEYRAALYAQEAYPPAQQGLDRVLANLSLDSVESTVK